MDGEVIDFMDDLMRYKNEDDNNYNPKKIENSIFFSNSLIQNSFNKMHILKRFFTKKENLTFIFYFNKWKKTLKKKGKQEMDRNSKEEHLLNNRRIIETYCDDVSFDYLNIDDLKNEERPLSKVILPLNIINSNNQFQNTNNSEKKISNGKTLLIILKRIFNYNLQFHFSDFKTCTISFINAKKIAKSNLNLLFLFSELAIAKNKLNKSEPVKSVISPNVIQDLERKIHKLELNLEEKKSIIENKNDRIENLSEQIEYLNEKISRLENKEKDLNVIQESLCKQCGNSMEESYMMSPQITPKKRLLQPDLQMEHLNLKDSEYKKTIQEQLEYIVKMEQEKRELRSQNIEYKSKNEMIINELEIIKIEFKNLSENMKNKNFTNMGKSLSNFFKMDTSCQTEEVIEISVKPSSQPIKKKTKSNSKKFSSKLTLNNSNNSNNNAIHSNQSKTASSGNINNYNIININNSKISSTNTSQISEVDKEVYQSLKFDNSILSQELVNLNKEINKFKSELKSLSEQTKKLDKEKSEIQNKFKIKSENYDKVKKENEELMILIQNANYKSFISLDAENKKIKLENEKLCKDNETNIKELSLRSKRLSDLEQELEKSKKVIESMYKFKQDRENLILENAKLDSEVKRTKYDLENIQNLNERQQILISNKEELLLKYQEDMAYLVKNCRMFKEDSEKNKQDCIRAVQDATAYEKIVRKLEKELAETQIRREKIENELNIIKAQFSKR
jgi:hypothetical protein